MIPHVSNALVDRPLRHTKAMSDRPCPTVMYLLENIDSIYASGMFCKAGPPGSRDDHYEVISSMRDMLGELAVARESALESKSPIFHARRYVEISPFTPSIL
jgi:hypothetical protein